MPVNLGKFPDHDSHYIFIYERTLLMLIVATLGLIGISLMTALPAAIAVFPQRGSLKTDNMEKEFHNLSDKDGNKVTTLYYNKGL